MTKRKLNEPKQTDNAQEKLHRAANPASDDNQNQNHNAKKVSLGPNTNR